MMEVQVNSEEQFKLIIETENEVAVAVNLDGSERIFLPEQRCSKGTYYQETQDALVETDSGYVLKLGSEPERFEVIN